LSRSPLAGVVLEAAGTPEYSDRPDSTAQSARVRREVWYEGRVQGVGFRYTTRRIADRFHVTGFVKNLPDGRVYLVAEGAVDEVERFLSAVSAELGRYIAATRQRGCATNDEFSDFEISL